MKNSIFALALGLVAFLVYLASLAGYAFPGESAQLLAAWQGLPVACDASYPLFERVAKLFAVHQVIAPVLGGLSVALVYLLVSFFVSNVTTGERAKGASRLLSRTAGAVAAVVFMLTPAVRESATHLEPRLFDAFWALLTFAVFVPYLRTNVSGLAFAALLGLMTALGLLESALFLALAPLVLGAMVVVELKRGRKPYASITLFAGAFLVAFLVFLKVFHVELTPFLKETSRELKSFWQLKGWLFVALFATLPFLVSLFSSARAFRSKGDLTTVLFHAALALVSILATATPLSPSALMRPHGVAPVASSFFAAAVAGYLVAFFVYHRKNVAVLAMGVVFAFVLAFNALWNLFAFDAARGAFADRVAEKILDDLKDRTWFVTDGSLDSHLLLKAKERGQTLHLVCLARDLDRDYLDELKRDVVEAGLGGAKNADLALDLSLGVLPFVQDWFAADPDVDKKVALLVAPDLVYSTGKTPIPEFLFFGLDPERPADWSAWGEFDALLHAPKGWGSYASMKDLSPLERLRLNLRRHMGLLANNRGVYLQEKGRDDEAFGFYERVLADIDADNICAAFNEMEMAMRKYPKAVAKERELRKYLKTIVEDKARRYLVWRLSSVYGYVRNPDAFIRLGFAWARSGRPGAALAQIRRALDLVPNEQRAAYLNMMAALYASESDYRSSRKIYEKILEKDTTNYQALMGMMRVSLVDGERDKALSYLERAIAAAPEAVDLPVERALAAMMKEDLPEATKCLREATDLDPKNLRAWSLLAAVVMQQADGTKDAKKRQSLLADVRDRILPAMEGASTNPFDYYVQTTKAFYLMRQGEEKRREARDALEAATRANPNASVMQDLMLNLDISLVDYATAERHARDVLRQNRKAPLANYVMGSLSMRQGDYRQAEAFLRRAVESPNAPVVAYNDLAEVLRRTSRLPEAESVIRQAIAKAPSASIFHQTLAEILVDRAANLDEAEKSARHAIELAKGANGQVEDVRLYALLAKIQVLRGDMKGARNSIRRVEAKADDLSDFERRDFEETKRRVR